MHPRSPAAHTILLATLLAAARTQAGDLSVRALALAALINRTNMALPQRDAAKMLAATPMQTTRAVKICLARGLIDHERCSTDRRQKLLRRTKLARETLHSIAQGIAA